MEYKERQTYFLQKAVLPVRWQWPVLFLLVISILVNIILFWKISIKEQDAMVARQQERQSAMQIMQLEQKVFQAESELAFMRSPLTEVILLNGVGQKNNKAVATTFWNKETKELKLNSSNLPEAPEGTQYQFWVQDRGEPLSAGFIEKSTQSLQRMKPTSTARAFIISLETAGGSTQLLPERVVAKGEVEP